MQTFRDPIEQNFIIGCAAARMIAPSHLNDKVNDEIVVNSRLYIVARRPRLVVAGVQSAPDGYVEFQLNGPDGTSAVETSLKTVPPFSVNLEDGGQWLTLQIDGDNIFNDKPSRLLHDPKLPPDVNGDVEALQEVADRFLPLEVLYIGKSDDEGGVAHKRLASHSKLQQILADHFDHAPGSELWVLPLVFNETSTVTAILPSEGEVTDEKMKNWQSAISPALSSEARVALAEAAMIRYFNPSYNTHYRLNFPDQKHLSYAEVLGYQYNSVGFVLNLASLNVAIGSETVQPAVRHEKQFPIEKASSRLPLTVDSIIESFRAHSGTQEER